MAGIPATAQQILCEALGIVDGNIGHIDAEEIALARSGFYHVETGEPLRFRDSRDKNPIEYTFVGLTINSILAFRKVRGGGVRDYSVEDLKHLVCARDQTQPTTQVVDPGQHPFKKGGSGPHPFKKY
jgi:hypothetical protein